MAMKHANLSTQLIWKMFLVKRGIKFINTMVQGVHRNIQYTAGLHAGSRQQYAQHKFNTYN